MSALRAGALIDFVVGAGLEWLVVADLKRLSANLRVARALDGLVPPARLDAYQSQTGVDLRRISSALVAGYDGATLYAFETRGGEVELEQRLGDRLALGAVRSKPHPSVRIVQGVIAGYPRTLVTVEGRFAAWSDGDPTPARAAALLAIGRLRPGHGALHSVAFSPLPHELRQAPFVAYAAGPMPAAWASAARGMLGASTAAAVGTWPSEDGVEVRLVLAGHWRAPDDERRAESAWAELASSPVGSLLGMLEPIEPAHARVSADSLLLELRVRLDLERLLSGARAMLGAELAEILDAPGGKAHQIDEN